MVRGVTSHVLVLLSLLMIECYKEPPPLPPGPFVSPETKYPIGPGDLIEVKLVPDDIGVSGTYQVDDEGRMLVPMIGELYVTGLTSVSLRQVLETQLSRYLKEPKVSVYVREMRSQKIFVWTPDRVGVIFVQRPINVLETVTMAGISPKDVKLSRIYVIRWDEGTRTSRFYSVNLEKILREGDFTQNVYLSAGDIVFIPPTYVRGFRDIIALYSSIGLGLLYGFSGFQIIGVAK